MNSTLTTGRIASYAEIIRMRPIAFRSLILLLAVVSGLLAGCGSMESMRGAMKDQISGVPPKVRMVDGNQREVYDAARRAMEKLGYRFTSGGPAQGRLDGLSSIGGSNDFRSSRQRSISIHLQGLEGGKVEVQVEMTEIIEEDSDHSAMPATETPLRDPTAFEVFFDELDRCLPAGKAR